MPSHWQLHGLRRAGLHQRRLSLPGRPAARARREPDRRPPARRSTCRRTGPARRRRAALRRRRLVPRVVAQRRGARLVEGQPAAGRVRRRPRCCGPAGERARGPRAPVVGRLATWRTRTCGGCPGIFRERDAARTARRARSTTSSSTPTTTTRPARARCGSTPTCPARVTVPELGIDAAAGETVTRAGRRAVERRAAPAVRRASWRPRASACGCGSASVPSSIEDGLLKVNGRRVLLRGVNRHEFHPDRGRTADRGDDAAATCC